MLFKRIIEGKSMLNADAKRKAPEKCSRRRLECDGCDEHSILEELMKMVLLGVVLWAGVTLGSVIAPYPLNLFVSPDNIHAPPMYNYPFPSANNLKRLPSVTTARVNKSLQFSEMNVNMDRTFENILKSAEITPFAGSAAQGRLIDGYPSTEAMHYQKSSTVITGASLNLVYTTCTRYGLQDDECASFISTLNLGENEYGVECAVLERFSCPNNKLSSKYRSFDGSCNNPVRSSWGQALTGYKRLLHPTYTDGINEPRRAFTLQRPLPSARLISLELVNNLDKANDQKTMALPVWSQFINHDLVHTPIRKMVHFDQAIRCCDADGFYLLPRYNHPSCLPIYVPGRDWRKHRAAECMDYVRSVTTYRGDCTFGAAEQMNQATHFLDGSQIYGSNSRDAAALREKTGGLLKTSTVGGEELLPLVDIKDKCLGGELCFNAGDIRVNQNPRLAALHVIWVREHNRIARYLSLINPEWTSDKVYHEARRIVVAEIQHITYKHWVQALTGKVYDELYEAYDVGYNSDINPTITNSFATAAFRFFNNLLDDEIQMVDGNKHVDNKRLKDNYYKSDLLGEKQALEKLMRGMITQKSQEMDLNFDDDLRHHWLGGLDVLAIDIQRGRDHGLPGYVHYRSMCGTPVTSFAQFTDIPQQVVDKLSKIYSNINDIDLIVGMMAETPLPNSQLGPTATCLIKEQLYRTKSGDRYFYTHAHEAGSFTKRQLAEIKKVTLARILCDNADVKFTQRDVFRTVDESNPVVSCEDIKKVNLQAWQASDKKPDLFTRTNKWLKNKVGGPGNETK